MTPTSAKSIPLDYEKIIQKLESDIRSHIRVEQQLKLHIESIQSQLEELQRLQDSKDDEESEKIQQLKDKMLEKDKQVLKL
jgi:hypothetical protein